MKVGGGILLVGSCALLCAACSGSDSDTDGILEITLEQFVQPAEETVEAKSPERSYVVASTISADRSPLSSVSISDTDGDVTCTAYPFDQARDILALQDVEPLDAGLITVSSGSDSIELAFDGEVENLNVLGVGYPIEDIETGDEVAFHDEWSVDVAGGSDIDASSATATTPAGFGGEDVLVRYLDFERLNVTPATEEEYAIQLVYVDDTDRFLVECDDVTGTFEWSFEPSGRVQPLKVYRESSAPLPIASGQGAFGVVSSRGISPSPPAEQWLEFLVSQTIQSDGSRTLDISSRSGQEVDEAPQRPMGCETIPIDDTLPDDPRVEAGDVTIAAGSVELMLMTNEFEYFGDRVDLDGPVDEWTFRATGGADTSNSLETLEFGQAPDSAEISVNADSIEISWTGVQQPHFEVSVSDGILGERLRCFGPTSPYVWDKTVGENEDVNGWVGSRYSVEGTSWDTTDVRLVTQHRRIADVN